MILPPGRGERNTPARSESETARHVRVTSIQFNCKIGEVPN
jgi:hypothetical protein